MIKRKKLASKAEKPRRGKVDWKALEIVHSEAAGIDIGGREHWVNCMSMLVAGGRIARGQVVGSTDAKGYDVKEARVTPSDLAATVYHHLGIDGARTSFPK